jgi:Protein of unknown function (DUF3072)
MTENQTDPLIDAPIDEDSPSQESTTTHTESKSESSTTEVTPSAEKDPSDWVTGDQPMTGPQGSYLHTLAQEAGHDVPDDLSKADASKMIDELQAETGRGGA